MNLRTVFFIILLVAILTGCASNPSNPAVVTVEVPIPVPCNINAPKTPSWPLQTSSVEENDLFTNVKLALAEIELRKGYEIELEAAIRSCNSK